MRPSHCNALCKYILPGLLVEWSHVMQVNHKLEALVNTRGIICTPPDSSCKIVVIFDFGCTGSGLVYLLNGAWSDLCFKRLALDKRH